MSSPLKAYHSYGIPAATEDDLREKCLPMTVLSDSVFGINNLEAIPLDKKESYYLKNERAYFEDDRAQQLELPLENPNDLLVHYKRMIHRYELAYEKMATYALKWYSLEYDAANDEVISKLLRDIQILRKLSGYTVL
jgi:hypothetical protein